MALVLPRWCDETHVASEGEDPIRPGGDTLLFRRVVLVRVIVVLVRRAEKQWSLRVADEYALVLHRVYKLVRLEQRCVVVRLR